MAPLAVCIQLSQSGFLSRGGRQLTNSFFSGINRNECEMFHFILGPLKLHLNTSALELLVPNALGPVEKLNLS